MQLFRYLTEEPLFPDGCVLTIGNFDGVHRGHQAILQRLYKRAQELKLPAVVMCFEPQPIEYFNPEKAPARLSTARDKMELLKKAGIDALYLVRFDQSVAQMSPNTFINQLVEKLRVRAVFVGDDFCFGKNRQGNYAVLKQAGEQFGFSVERTASIKVSDERVSSTLIRNLLDQGELEKATNFLGRSFSLSGRVMHGKKRGRQIGFPTANVRVKNRKTPLSGVFAVTIQVENERMYYAVANVGVRPSVERDERVFLEAHLFDFEGDLYTKRLRVTFCKKLREERKFETLEQLTQQIEQDASLAKQHFNID